MATTIPRFKDQQHAMLLEEWHKVCKDLREAVALLVRFCEYHKLPPVIVTSLISGPHGPNSQHYYGEAADIRCHNGYYNAEQMAKMDNYMSETVFRTDMIGKRQARCFFAHGDGSNFHIHLSVDKQPERTRLDQPSPPTASTEPGEQTSPLRNETS